jgi:nitroimidazol reductase NimA-like FMN-containing flavoprotein (pyridoxamine 5'-phosphate oxidase superfamily)
MPTDVARTRLTELLASQPLAVLATAGCTTPYANLVAYAFSADLRRLWFATPRGTRKYANLRTDSRVALLIDNRSNCAADFAHGMAATAQGRAEELSGPAAVEGRERLLARHPDLADFLAPDSCGLFSVRVATYTLVQSLAEVVDLAMD